MEPFSNLIRREQKAADRKRNYLRGAKDFVVTDKTAEMLAIEAHCVSDAVGGVAAEGDVRLVRIEACEVASGMRNEQSARGFLQRNSFRAWRMSPTTESGQTIWLSRGGVYKEHEPIVDDIVMAESITFNQAAPVELYLARVGLADLVIKHKIDQTYIVQDINRRLEQYEGY